MTAPLLAAAPAFAALAFAALPAPAGRDEPVPGHPGALVDALPLAGFDNLGLPEDRRHLAALRGRMVLLYEIPETEPETPERDAVLERVRRYTRLHDLHRAFGLVVLPVIARSPDDYRVIANELSLRTPFACYASGVLDKARAQTWERLGPGFGEGVLLDAWGLLVAVGGVDGDDVQWREPGCFSAPLHAWPKGARKVLRRVDERDLERAFEEAEGLAGDDPERLDDLNALGRGLLDDTRATGQAGDLLTARLRAERLRDELAGTPFDEEARALHEEFAGGGGGDDAEAVRKAQREVREAVNGVPRHAGPPRPRDVEALLDFLDEVLERHPDDAAGREARAWRELYAPPQEG